MIGSQLNHYKILEKLGTGGMGEVYVAEDTRLNRRVAIKILPEDLAADPERRERFEREAQTIAALNHPNIVTIYSVEESDGLHFITMELVEGRSLGDLVPDGGMKLADFFKLAVPMVDALDAAHKKGITHRDIKPSNVMVTDEGRIKVLDFGLAKLARQESPLDPAEAATMLAPSDLTEQGQILGTVNYMSPEQAEGKGVDHRSDIFSLGVVLYEMATGEAPFKGDTKISVITSIMRDTPPPVSDLNVELPQHLGRVVNRSLAKDPERRYQSTTDLRNELEDLKEEIATSELRQSAVRMKGAPAAAGGGLKYLGVAAGVVAVLTVGYLVSTRGVEAPDAPPPPAVAVVDAKPSLAVLYFENLSGDESLDWLRTGLTDMLVTDLAQSQQVRVLGTDRLHQILADIGAADDEMTSAGVVAAVAEQGNVETVLLGSFARAGNVIRISARLQEAASGEILASETVEGEGEEAIFPLVDDLTKRIKAQFDVAEEVMAADTDADLTDVTTDSLEAYRYYAEGIRLHEELRENEAIPMLERAVEIDPDFAMALAKLATAYSNVGDQAKSREYSERAMEHLDRVTDRERYYIEGRHYSLQQETADQAIDAYQKAVDMYPDHTSARNNLAAQLLNQERFDEAIGHLEELRRSGMQFPGTYATLANAYGMMGRFDDGLDVLREYTAAHPDNAAGFENLAAQLVWAGRLDEADQTLETAERLGRPFPETAGLHWEIAALRDDWDDAGDLVERMLEGDETRDRINGTLMSAVGELFAGDLGDATDLLDELEEIPQARITAFNQRSTLYLDLGDFDAALALADRQASLAGADPQMMLDSVAGRALAIGARSGVAAAEVSVTELWDAVEALNLPARIIAREERRFRAQLAFYAGEWQQAVTLFDEALDRMPPRAARGDTQRPRVHYMLGVAQF
ncbi:MAG: protein kinase, partial [Acidobacteriota bacterium]